MRATIRLADLLANMKQTAEARRLLEGVIAAYTAQWGALHDTTLDTQVRLAELLAEIREDVAARSLLEGVLAAQTERRGASDEETLDTMRRLARCDGLPLY